MPIHKLTPRKVATAGPGKHEDGGGLRLVVSRTGARKWMLRFTLTWQAPGDGPGQLRRRGAGRGAGARRRVPEAGQAWPRSHRGPADQTGRAHLHRLCRPLCPGAPARLDQRQACPAVGEHPQDLCPTSDRLQAGGRHHHRGHPEGPIPTLDRQDRNRQAGAGPHRKHPRLCRCSSVPRPAEPGPLAGSPGQAAAEALPGEDSPPPSRDALSRSARLHGGAVR